MTRDEEAGRHALATDERTEMLRRRAKSRVGMSLALNIRTETLQRQSKIHRRYS